MKILFISSGYDRIYNHFEDWILRELRTKHEVIFFQINKGLPVLKSLTKSFKPEAAITLVGKELPIRMVQWLKITTSKDSRLVHGRPVLYGSNC